MVGRPLSWHCYNGVILKNKAIYNSRTVKDMAWRHTHLLLTDIYIKSVALGTRKHIKPAALEIRKYHTVRKVVQSIIKQGLGLPD